MITTIDNSIKESYFIIERDPENIDFTDWRVLPGVPKDTPIAMSEFCFTTLDKAWPVEFSVWMNHRFILVSPGCPEAYFIDSEPILKICNEIKEKYWEGFYKMAGVYSNADLWSTEKYNPTTKISNWEYMNYNAVMNYNTNYTITLK